MSTFHWYDFTGGLPEYERFIELPQEERDRLADEAISKNKDPHCKRTIFDIYYHSWNEGESKPEKLEPIKEVNIVSILGIEIEPELKAEIVEFLTEYEEDGQEDNYQRDLEIERRARIQRLKELAKGAIIN